jgi:acyl-CoA synthetase (AMP-forming)/AMP-acid ligase II
VKRDIAQVVASLFTRQSDRTFLIELSTGRRLTYAAFLDLALRAAALLRDAGVGRHERVVLILENSSDFAALYFGCLLSGVVAVPVNPLLHASEVDFIVSHAGGKQIIHSPATKKLLPKTLPCPSLCLVPLQERTGDANEGQTLEALAPLAAAPLLESIDAEALFSITFTSGTSALPKGVAHRVGSLLDNARVFNELLGLTEDHRFLHVMTMGYMAGFLNTLLCPFMAGASVVLAPAFNPQTPFRFWVGVREHQANTFWLSPTMAAALVALDRDPAGPAYAREHLRVVSVGTAPLSLRIRRDFERKYGVPLLESYGLSELLLLTSNTPQGPRLEGSVGQLLPGVEVRIVDEQGAETTGDGEICVRTPHVTAGYLDYATGNPTPFDRAAWFPTGDVGHLDAAGQLFITGRKKDLIIRGGVNISPRAIEEVLLEHPAIEQIAVVGLPHPFYGEEVVAAVILRPGRALDQERDSLKASCAARLSATSVPARFVQLDALPMSANGKVQKNILRERLSQEATNPPAQRGS